MKTKFIILFFVMFLVAGCNVIKPLPGNETITIGKEGIGIDQIADDLIDKASNIKNRVSSMDNVGEIIDIIANTRNTINTNEEGKEIEFEIKEEIAELISVVDNGGDGYAKRLHSDKQYSLKIFANLSKLENDSYYEVWIVKSDPLDYISVGKLVLEQDQMYHLNFIANTDHMKYNKIVITKEAFDDNPNPGAYILEAKFD